VGSLAITATKIQWTVAILASILIPPLSSAVPSQVQGVKVEVTAVSPARGLLHWKVTNTSDVEIYVYDLFLWGPSYRVRTKPDSVVFETSPTEIQNGYPNHVPPLLLLLVPAHESREGDFKDPQIKSSRGKRISFEIGVGSEPYKVIEDYQGVRRRGEGTSSPFNVVLQWSTIFASPLVKVPNK
jgi:hypothetical protein